MQEFVRMTSAKNSTATYQPIFRDQLATVADLQVLKTEILMGIRRILAECTTQPEKKWLKTHQARKILGCSAGTLLTLRTNGTLPYTKVGGTIFYASSDIDKVLSSHVQHSGQLPGKKAAAKKT